MNSDLSLRPKAMVLAAGLGKRMHPLTLTQPKPLLRVAGKALIDYQLAKLADAGVTDVVINLHWLGEQLTAHIGDGAKFGLAVRYSEEPELLETAGGILEALPLLGEQPFIVVNSDVYTDFDYQRLALPEGRLAHLVFVENPAHNRGGDFSLSPEGDVVLAESGQSENGGLTFAGVSIMHPALFKGYAPGKLALRPVLESAISKGLVSGQLHTGMWVDVGTPERLAQLDKELQAEIQHTIQRT